MSLDLKRRDLLPDVTCIAGRQITRKAPFIVFDDADLDVACICMGGINPIEKS